MLSRFRDMPKITIKGLALFLDLHSTCPSLLCVLRLLRYPYRWGVSTRPHPARSPAAIVEAVRPATLRLQKTRTISGSRNAWCRDDCGRNAYRWRIDYHGTIMPILSIKHVTTYHYNRAVAFGEHRMMLRPRDDDDQRVIESGLEITPCPRQLAWTKDSFGNHVATAHFGARARELRFASSIRLDHAPSDFRATDIEDFARTYPFAYAPEDRPGLERFLQPLSPHPAVDLWSAAFFREDGSADTYALLGDMTRIIRRTFKHVTRHEKGIQAPAWTLKLGSGSCRDLAVLMIAALRARGIAARFVSGYLHLADDGDDDTTAATPMPGFRFTCPVRAGSTSIHREASWEIKISSASRSHMTRAR